MKGLFGKRRGGWTLTELAIVMGVMGVVLAAIWLVAGNVWNNYKFYRANQQIMAVVRNVREAYGPTGRPLPPSGTDITATAVNEGFLPSDMASGANYTHAFGGRFQLLTTNASLASRLDLRVLLSGLSRENCMKMLMEFPVLMPEIGVARIGEGASSLPASSASLPMTAAMALTWCDSLTNNGVFIDFKVRL